jgi:signal transduction histidine kinase
MGITSVASVNLDLLSVGIAVAATALLGFIIYFNNPRSITNQTFLLFSLVTVLWSCANYINYKVESPILVLWLLRMVIFFGVWHAFTFFQLFYVFPLEKKEFPKVYKFILFPIVVCVSMLTLTPFVFPSINKFSTDGSVSTTILANGVYPFVFLVLFLVGGGIFHLISKIRRASSDERKPYWLILIGTLITFALLMTFNLILPALFLNVRYIPFGALFIFPFIAFTSYAIYRHHLFNLKVAATAFLGFMVTVFSFVNVVYSDSFSAVAINVAAFVIILLGSIKIVQDTLNLEIANEKLKKLDQMKSEFLSIASHQLRAPITVIRGYASLILEGDYGETPEKLREPLARIGESARNMASAIEDYLNISRIEQGRMKYEKSTFNLADLVKKVVEEMLPVAARRGLALTYEAHGPLSVTADVGKIKQVISNLVDNAIKYTEKGKVQVTVNSKQLTVGNKQVAQITVTDTGMGISREEISGLFEKFTRARDANKVNTTGTGLGLYVAKQLVEGHGGTIRAESDGPGKGSRFVVELPT